MKPFQLVLKRLFDILVSAAILALASPLLIPVAILIKLTSPGPSSSQRRVGLYGREFNSQVPLDGGERRGHAGELWRWNEQEGPVFRIRETRG
jgi:hypothetical protein